MIISRLLCRRNQTLFVAKRAALVTSQRRLLASGGQQQPSEKPSAILSQQGRNVRERELILNVLSTVPSPREARKFLNSVYGSETMRSQRAFEEQQARLATQQQQVVKGRSSALVPGAIHMPLPMSHTEEEEAVAAAASTLPRKLTALVFVDGLGDRQVCRKVGKQLAQMQRIGVSPIVLVAMGDLRGYRETIGSAHALADAIEQEGGKARPINDGVFYTNPYTKAELSVDPELLGSAVAQNLVPIVTPLVADTALRVSVLEIGQAAPAMARALVGMASVRGGQFALLLARLILLSSRIDGLSAADGLFHRFVNLEEDYAEIEHKCTDQGTLQLMRTCLGILPPTAAGIVASVHSDPSLVLKGLISERPVNEPQRRAPPSARQQQGGAARNTAEHHRLSVPNYKPLAAYPFAQIGGGGSEAARKKNSLLLPPAAALGARFTLLRHGFRIERHTSVATCSMPQLRALLESSFGRRLASDQYFERLRSLEAHGGGIEIIIAGDYQGAVVVTHEDIGAKKHLPYLDKFAVLPSVQGTGMADILWTQLRRACPSCMWRSRNDNGVNKWYFDRSHGHARSAAAQDGSAARWVFFWYQSQAPGLPTLSIDDVQAGIRAAQSIPPSFV
ncbi:Amino-acid acetyltransferase, mitochondrial [Coemansia sp. RSA 2559]|nr:Amino-acid acetyltransferase, mitochondrial [Coemansia sp. RSA 2559]KAJ2869226.1 Amino-acid acetyltransferase, mitochondrial [Coemansia erecta]